MATSSVEEVAKEEENNNWLLLELELGEAAETFNLEKAVCSHGLFMMAPNYWDPLSNTLSRPLTIPLHHDHAHVTTSTTATANLMVRISHPSHTPHLLHVHVHASPHSLSPRHKQALLGQVVRMLRLSTNDERNVREFRKIVESTEAAEYLRCFSGRVFRSPTLFEDMVKCILLCNCQWSRTLSMAKALCELQWELQHNSSSVATTEAGSMNTKGLKVETGIFIPKTPARKDLKRKLRLSKISKKSSAEFSDTKVEMQAGMTLKEDCEKTTLHSGPSIFQKVAGNDSKPCLDSEVSTANSHLISDHQSASGKGLYAYDRIGNFPCPMELSYLSETYLARRCNLGYRASRIIKLARAIVEGRIQLKYLEEACLEANLSSYDKLAEQLSQIDGFGPFTCANVLMCMGFYHVIPSDSETMRHLKQVHARDSTIQTVRKDVEKIYRKFEPFQFLAYWAEIWHFYERRFGKLSSMPYSEYKLITASNMKTKANSCGMKTKANCKEKRTKKS